MIKILITDDHAIVRSGVRQFLANEEDVRIVEEAGTGKETLKLIREKPLDLLLLDISLPDINGFEILKQIKLEKPRLPIIIFSMFSEDDYALFSLEAGASGYVPKDAAPSRILEAIRRVCRGERYVSPELTEKLLAGNAGIKTHRRHDVLSPREFAIMILICRGMTLVNIGKQLNLSPKTVSTYRTRILNKLCLNNNIELARYVIEHKLDTESR